MFDFAKNFATLSELLATKFLFSMFQTRLHVKLFYTVADVLRSRAANNFFRRDLDKGQNNFKSFFISHVTTVLPKNSVLWWSGFFSRPTAGV